MNHKTFLLFLFLCWVPRGWGMEQLPADCLVEILKQLVTSNNADTLKSLALTDKQLHIFVNGPKVTNLLITAIQAHYNTTAPEAASRLKTLGAKQWIERYVKQSGEYALFKAAQKILMIAHGINMKALQRPYCSLDKNFIIDSKPNVERTKNGLFLEITTFANRLVTPWGSIELYKRKSKVDKKKSMCDFTSLLQDLLGKIDVTLENLNGDNFFHVTHRIPHDAFEKSREKKHIALGRVVPDAAKDVHLGTSALVLSLSNKNTSKYTIHNDGGFTILDTPLPYDKRTSYLIQFLWKFMSHLYCDEILVNKMEQLTLSEYDWTKHLSKTI